MTEQFDQKLVFNVPCFGGRGCPMANGAAIKMLASPETYQNYLSVMRTVPLTDSPTQLSDFGYGFDASGRLYQLATGTRTQQEPAI
jgi:hypothetical protein